MEDSDFAAPPELAILAEELTCSICKQLFDGPVSLQCGHVFCSGCIRQSFAFNHAKNQNQICPTCRDPSSTAALRPVTALRKAAQALPAAAAAVETLRLQLQRRAAVAEQEAATLRAQLPQHQAGLPASQHRSAPAAAAGAESDAGPAGDQQQAGKRSRRDSIGASAQVQAPSRAPQRRGAVCPSGGGVTASWAVSSEATGLRGEHDNGDGAGVDGGGGTVAGGRSQAEWDGEEAEMRQPPAKRLRRGAGSSGGGGGRRGGGSAARSSGGGGGGTSTRRDLADGVSGSVAHAADEDYSPGAAKGSSDNDDGDNDDDDDYSPGSEDGGRLGSRRGGRLGRGGGASHVNGHKQRRGWPPKAGPGSGAGPPPSGVFGAPELGPPRSTQGPATAAAPPPLSTVMDDCPLCGFRYAQPQLQAHVELCMTRKGFGGGGYGSTAGVAGARVLQGRPVAAVSASPAATAQAPTILPMAAPAAAVAVPPAGPSSEAAPPKVDIKVPPARNFHAMKVPEAKRVMTECGLPTSANKQEMADLYIRYRTFLQTEKDRCTAMTMRQLLRVFLRNEQQADRAKRQPAEAPGCLKAMIAEQNAKMDAELAFRRRQATSRRAAEAQAEAADAQAHQVQGLEPGQQQERVEADSAAQLTGPVAARAPGQEPAEELQDCRPRLESKTLLGAAREEPAQAAHATALSESAVYGGIGSLGTAAPPAVVAAAAGPGPVTPGPVPRDVGNFALPPPRSSAASGGDSSAGRDAADASTAAAAAAAAVAAAALEVPHPHAVHPAQLRGLLMEVITIDDSSGEEEQQHQQQQLAEQQQPGQQPLREQMPGQLEPRAEEQQQSLRRRQQQQQYQDHDQAEGAVQGMGEPNADAVTVTATRQSGEGAGAPANELAALQELPLDTREVHLELSSGQGADPRVGPGETVAAEGGSRGLGEMLASDSDGGGSDDGEGGGSLNRSAVGRGGGNATPGLAACILTPHPSSSHRAGSATSQRIATAASPAAGAVVPGPAVAGGSTPLPCASWQPASAAGLGTGGGGEGGGIEGIGAAAWRGLLRATPPLYGITAGEGLVDISNGTGGQRSGLMDFAAPAMKGGPLLQSPLLGADGLLSHLAHHFQEQ